jgi:hypothetical protein
VKYCFTNRQFPPLACDASENKLSVFTAIECGLDKIMAWITTTTQEGGVPHQLTTQRNYSPWHTVGGNSQPRLEIAIKETSTRKNLNFIIIALMMQAARTLVNFYQTTRRYNPEDSHLRTHCRENLKS